LLVKAIEFEYKNEKFDEFSWSLLFLNGAEFLNVNSDELLSNFSKYIRSFKLKDDKHWNALLPENKFEPYYIPKEFFFSEDTKKEKIKEFLNKPFDELLRDYNDKVKSVNFIKNRYRDLIPKAIDSIQSFNEDLAEKLASILNASDYTKEQIGLLNAFLVGLKNGILELVAGLIDIGALLIIIAKDELGFKITDKLVEAIEGLLEELFYNTKAFIKNLFTKINKLLIDIDKWYTTKAINPYYRFRVLGEIVPDIVTIMIAWLKGAKIKNAAKLVDELIVKAEKQGVEFTNDTAKIAKTKLLNEPINESANQALEETGKKLEKEIKDVLDEGISDASRPRKLALIKWASKFEKKFHLHFDGEIVPVLHNDGTVAYYKMVGAHNHEKIGDVFELIAIRIPPGIKFANLPNDIPFKANVEMIKDGVKYTKKATSTFFPKNWDIKRVKEEIALVYEEMIRSGKTYHSRSTNRKFDYMNSEGTFEIHIEFDELGNITNAYPIIK